MAMYAWFKQDGEGCDYTIGCGERLVPLAPGDAIAQVRQWLSEHENLECVIKEVFILSNDVQQFNLNEYHTEKTKRSLEMRREAAEEKEREQYEKLKAKFG